jgi:hypothetical protein
LLDTSTLILYHGVRIKYLQITKMVGDSWTCLAHPGTALTAAKKNYRFHIVTEPAGLTEQKSKELTDTFVSLACQTTGGEDWQSYRPAIEGWREYYTTPGARPQDFDRIVLIYDEDQLVHFTGVTRFDLDPSHHFVYIRIAMTLKQYHRAGLLRSAVLSVLSPEWIKHNGEFYFVSRTANPVIYETTRQFAREFSATSDLDLTMYPQITEECELEPMPDEIRDLAGRVAEKISPGCGLDPSTFLNRGYYKRFGPIYKEPVYYSHNPVTNRYFEQTLDHSNQDGILLLIHVQPRLHLPG